MKCHEDKNLLAGDRKTNCIVADMILPYPVPPLDYLW
jgi:hypothetical protein